MTFRRRKVARKGYSKYRNKWVQYDGHWFQSGKEGTYYLMLREQLKQGIIVELELQPRIDFPCNCRFTPDFRVVYSDGREVYYDVKSPITRKETAYRIRVKLLRYFFPEKNFEEV